MTLKLPLLIETEALEKYLNHENILIVQVSSKAVFEKIHLPNAKLVTPHQLMSGNIPAQGSVPSKSQLTLLMQSIGLTSNKHVIAYDDEGGGWAGRLIWTLDYINHKNTSYLNGGLHAWYADKRELASGATSIQHSNFEINKFNEDVRATAEFIMQKLYNEDFEIWDARSLQEFNGSQVFAQRGGHIPGATHFEWTQLMDKENNLRLLPLEKIQQSLDHLGLLINKQIVTHCQSHHRSGLTYLVAKILGYKDIKAYDGSWSEWGNQLNLPVDS